MALNYIQTYLLTGVLPSILFPMLIALAAGLGMARWRRILVVLVIVGLALFVSGALVLIISAMPGPGYASYPESTASSDVPFIALLQSFATPAIIVSTAFIGAGEVLALILAARSRSWRWFSVLIVAALIQHLAIQFALSPFGLIAFGTGTSRALQIFYSPAYRIPTYGIASLAMLVLVLYAVVGARASTILDSATD